MFGKKKETVILPENAKCSRCRKKIRKGEKFSYIGGKLYCRKCTEAKKDWDILEMMMILDDD